MDLAAFLARHHILWLSLAARSDDLLDLEDLHRFSNFLAVLPNYSEDGHGNAMLSLKVMLHGLLHLPVEEPLVDLDPREARRFDRTLALLAI